MNFFLINKKLKFHVGFEMRFAKIPVYFNEKKKIYIYFYFYFQMHIRKKKERKFLRDMVLRINREKLER